MFADLGPFSDGTLYSGGAVGAFLLIAGFMSREFRQSNKDREAYQKLFVDDAGHRLEAMQMAATRAEAAKDEANAKLEEFRRVADQAQRQLVAARRALRDCQDDRRELTTSVTSLQARMALLSTERSDVADMKVELASMRATVAALAAPGRRAEDPPDADYLPERTLPPTTPPLEG